MPEARTNLALPADQARVAFSRVAEANGLDAVESATGLVIQARLGQIELRGEGAGTLLRIEAGSDGDLQIMRDLLSARLESMGQTPAWQDAVAGRRPANLSVAQVVSAEQLSPSYIRVVIEGDDLARFNEGGLHFRLLFGPEGADLPATDEAGVTRWPGGIEAWHRPVYTTRKIVTDGEAARITFDVFVHEGGRVTDCARGASRGDSIAITGPGGSKLIEGHRWMGLVGDETAVPVIARQLAALPEDTRGKAVLFVPEQADVQTLAHPPGIELAWVLRSEGLTPLEAFDQLGAPRDGSFRFFAGERSEAVALRARLTEAAAPRESYQVAAYWTAPEA
ncbi:siderophore-interacting protein [Vannielia litorea]|uniref:siderophore-interacting protein n=1 Tax=Vannielia litorea TaxID=1217970 RepID=UPI001C966E28|nr:siderophore-interacting protein [Vannielia litorea]MBY6153780.1 siderophore-interacting protein [Vannielia litorea]